MKRLAPLFSATAFAVSGGVLANTADEALSPGESRKPGIESATRQPHGFVVLQRNIDGPVDADGKVSSENWIVVEQQGFVSADEVNAAHAGSGMGAPGAQSNEGHGESADAERAPSEKPAPTPHAVPSHEGGLPPMRGPFIAS